MKQSYPQNKPPQTFDLGLGRLPPQAIEVEEMILGAVLLESDAILIASETLRPSDFYKECNQRIFAACIALYSQNLPIDILTVYSRLGANGEIELTGGRGYLIDLTVKVGSAANIATHCRIVLEKSIRRQLISASSQAIKNGYDDSVDMFSALEQSQQGLYDIVHTTSAEKVADMGEQAFGTIRKLRKGVQGVPSVYEGLNLHIALYEDETLTIWGARPAVGKCHSINELCLMYDGTLKKVQDIQVGDQIMGSNSKPRNVLSLVRGQSEMYEVRQNRGITYGVNEEHILSLKRSRNEGAYKRGDILNISVRDYIRKSKRFKSNWKGYKVAVGFDEQPITLEPYFLGLWLADGSSHEQAISSPDAEIKSYLHNYADRLGVKIHQTENKQNTCSLLRIAGLRSTLRELNLIGNKHIPHNYSVNSEVYRLELLAGLLDGDGHYQSSTNVYEITQTRKRLAEQIKFLADSLGFRTSITEKTARIKSTNFSGQVYRVFISGNLDSIPCKVERKKARTLKAYADWHVTAFDVVSVGYADYYGFNLDGDHLYLLSDCTVTHNSLFGTNEAIGQALAGYSVIRFMLEMSVDQENARSLSYMTAIDHEKIRRGQLSADEWKRLEQAAADLSELKIYQYDMSALTILQMRTIIRKHMRKAEPGEKFIVYVDYLQLMDANDTPDFQNRNNAVGQVSRGLKVIAKDFKIPVVAFCQLSRGVEGRADKVPGLSDLRDSGQIEQDADVVGFFFRPEYYNIKDWNGKPTAGLFLVILAKNRSGSLGTVEFMFRPEISLIEEESATNVMPF